MSIFRKLILFSSALIMAGIPNQIYSQKLTEIDIKSNILISNSIEEREIKTVTASGFGTTIETAAQNAAENALIQVVGSFIDAETQIKKQTEIRNGVINKTKIIRKDISDYSQGSIKYFEILNIDENGSIYNVTARVDIRIDDFKVYIKKLASNTTQFNKDLYTSIQVEKSNKKERKKLLNKVIFPIKNGEVINVKRGTQQILEDFSGFQCKIGDNYLNCPNDSVWIKNFSKRGTFVTPYIFEIKENFLKNSLSILENTADEKFVSKLFSQSWQNDDYRRRAVGSKDFGIQIIDQLNQSKFYRFDELLLDSKYFGTIQKDRSIMLSFRNSTAQDICIHQQKMKYKTTNSERPGIYCLGSKIYLEFLKPYGHPGYNPWGMNYITQNQHGGGRVGIIFEKIRVLLFIEPTEAFINKVDNIKIEFI